MSCGAGAEPMSNGAWRSTRTAVQTQGLRHLPRACHRQQSFGRGQLQHRFLHARSLQQIRAAAQLASIRQMPLASSVSRSLIPMLEGPRGYNDTRTSKTFQVQWGNRSFPYT